MCRIFMFFLPVLLFAEIEIHLLSYHLNNVKNKKEIKGSTKDYKLNNFNYGIGYNYNNYGVGFIRNSFKNISYYVRYTYLVNNSFSVGIGLFTGYKKFKHEDQFFYFDHGLDVVPIVGCAYRYKNLKISFLIDYGDLKYSIFHFSYVFNWDSLWGTKN